LASKKTCIALITIVLCVLAATVKAQPAGAARGMLVGIYDPVQPIATPDTTFPTLVKLRAQIIRLNLDWNLIATRRPAKPTDPADPAYDWSTYDKVLLNAAKNKIQVLFTVIGTPKWANGKLKGTNRAPVKPADLRNFALAAAKRYSGTFKRGDGVVLPSVRKWLAWNEPNNPVFLKPQFTKISRHKYRLASPRIYAGMCNAIMSGVHLTGLAGEKVACGVTAPRGNTTGTQPRASVSPLIFLRGLKRAHARFDVYAHHPYYQHPNESPRKPPPGPRAITLGNINELLRELTRLYGNKHLWITEYGYQTNPPDRNFGVSWTKQATYLSQAYGIARANPRIDMMIWFLIRDEARIGNGWQSGLYTATGRRKPSWQAFRRMPK
jgi:hypothetical protein